MPPAKERATVMVFSDSFIVGIVCAMSNNRTNKKDEKQQRNFIRVTIEHSSANLHHKSDFLVMVVHQSPGDLMRVNREDSFLNHFPICRLYHTQPPWQGSWKRLKTRSSYLRETSSKHQARYENIPDVVEDLKENDNNREEKIAIEISKFDRCSRPEKETMREFCWGASAWPPAVGSLAGCMPATYYDLWWRGLRLECALCCFSFAEWPHHGRMQF